MSYLFQKEQRSDDATAMISSPDRALWKLQERVKELTALHRMADILQNDRQSISMTMQEIVNILPPAWQYPEITAARITLGSKAFFTPNFSPSPWTQFVRFGVNTAFTGMIEVVYLQEKPVLDEGPFLDEERSLINSLGQMVQAYLERKWYRRVLKRNNERLERQISQRTRQIEEANRKLVDEIKQRSKAEKRVRRYQKDLQKLVSDLALTEERERRNIAADLHDQLGQCLALLKMKVLELHGEAIFYGMENRIDEVSGMINKIIQFTRSLTAEICPSILYDLGLGPAIEWLSERFKSKYRLSVVFSQEGDSVRISEELRGAIFKGVRELLSNVVKHAQTAVVRVKVVWSADKLMIEVGDDGIGFETSSLKRKVRQDDCFGLFSLRERIVFLGGSMIIDSKPGKGTRVVFSIPI
ncbi:MAG: hypothetical protein HQM09_14880 [Candidatus Riflebacteria bacterium]|nr:hypothetical protein [Candidatus Riflebacteria bacterium]